MVERASAQAPTVPASVNSPIKKARLPFHKRPSSTSYPTQDISSGALLGSSRRERTVFENSKTDENMTACFLQYCAMCEKQISTPSNYILYCSEACRRKDSIKPLSAANIMAASPPLTATPSSPRPISQPRTPTETVHNANVVVSRIPTDHHDFKSDLDPTEWKPKLLRSGRPTPDRYNSEAFRYLSSFHHSINKVNDPNITHDESRTAHPNMQGFAGTAPTTPSLGNTPNTIASSWGMSASAGYQRDNGYDYATRPLLPRHNRWYSASVIGGSGIDLVTPHIPPPVDIYAKKDIVVNDGEKTQGGLGAFFG